MNRKNYKKHVSYELLVVLGMSVILLFVCRLWPLLILALLGMLGAAAWLILANRNAEEPDKPCASAQPRAERGARTHTGSDFRHGARRAPERALDMEDAERQALVCSGEDASILLNRAGGYREAVVHMSNGEVENIEYLLPPEPQKTNHRRT